jgi:hypothetical protein
MLWEAEETCLLINPMHKNQHAFRKNNSCDIAVSRVVNFIEKSIFNGQFTLGVFLDIQGAFDNVSTNSIKEGMEAHGFPPEITHWYLNYIQNRSCITSLQGKSITR